MPSAIPWHDLLTIAPAVFLMGMNKGGFPIGAIALPILILMWPDQHAPARQAVAFMLPILCAMDLAAIWMYRRHILWSRVKPLLPGTLIGITIGTLLFVAGDSAALAVSDRVLEACIGVLGLLFVGFSAASARVLGHLDGARNLRPLSATLFGVGAGTTSTLAHASGPLVQMYLLPQDLPKMNFAATAAAYYWVLNLIKLIPFVGLGRLEVEHLKLGLYLLPLVPLGTGTGYLLVRLARQKHYTLLIHVVLLATSLLLIHEAVLK